jgi:hypothetical protein
MCSALPPDLPVSYCSTEDRASTSVRTEGKPVTDLIVRQGGVSDLPHAPRPVPVEDTALPRFTLLGPVQVRTDDRDHTPTAPKLRQLLALLMMRSGHTLHPEAIVHELWSREAPPRNVRSCVQTLVYQLRRCLDDAGPHLHRPEQAEPRERGIVDPGRARCAGEAGHAARPGNDIGHRDPLGSDRRGRTTLARTVRNRPVRRECRAHGSGVTFTGTGVTNT